MPLQNMNETTTCIVAGVALVAILTLYSGLGSFVFTTPTHHVSFCNRFGAVFNQTYYPGIHWKDPFTTCDHIFAQEQVDSVKNVQCGTVDGIQLVFPQIDVHNILPADNAYGVYMRAGKDYDQLWIFKLVQFFVGQQCAIRTAENISLTGFNDLDEGLTADLTEYQVDKETGLFILKAKYHKPTALNSNILDEFKKRAEAKAKRKALVVEEDTIKQQNNNALKVAKGKNDLEAAKAAAGQRVETLALEADLERKQKAAEAARVEGQSNNLRELELAENKAKIQVEAAKAKLEAMKLEAAGNQKLLTKEYLEKERGANLGKLNKVFYGANIGDVFRLKHE